MKHHWIIKKKIEDLLTFIYVGTEVQIPVTQFANSTPLPGWLERLFSNYRHGVNFVTEKINGLMHSVVKEGTVSATEALWRQREGCLAREKPGSRAVAYITLRKTNAQPTVCCLPHTLLGRVYR